MLVRTRKWDQEEGKTLRKMVKAFTFPWDKDRELDDEDIAKFYKETEALREAVEHFQESIRQRIQEEREFWDIVEDVRDKQKAEWCRQHPGEAYGF